ncbi:multicopper oxidase family protein [Vulgatibacter sp.]|uniref:multicopper oxidase family protein n=1 Tax=Vulgatibacter sp. TaxID=1971226 RepID=UPI0035684428
MDPERIFELEAREEAVEVGGRQVRLLTYGGSFPGPLLALREGERVRIRFRNGLDEPTNLHLHGIPLPPEVDAPHRVLQPGESADYAFRLQPGSAGTYWYHPHLHGQVARQLGAGLAGALVVRGPVDETVLAGIPEQTLLLHDLALGADGTPLPPGGIDWLHGQEGDLVLVNGAVEPALHLPATLSRIRLVNAATARYFHLDLPGAELFLVGQDGGILEAPVAVERLLLAPGERADVLVRADAGAALVLRGLPYARGGKKAAAEALPLARIEVGNLQGLPLPARLREVELLEASTAHRTRRITWGGAMRPLRFFVNGRAFDPHRVDVHARLGTTEIWEIRNPMHLDHPFHLHTHAFQILDRDGVPEPFRAWRDVVNVRPGEVVRILVPFREHPGLTMFHCHIVEHEDRGMMAHLEVLEG